VCPPTCPVHNASSPADVSLPVFSRFVGEDSKFNTVEVEYHFTNKVGARVGYRYGNRQIKHTILAVANELFFPSNANRGDYATEPINPDGTCTFVGTVDEDADFDNVHEYSALFGFWIHPSSALRVNYDMELFSADDSPTRISPRKLQRYKGRVHYQPAGWANVSGTVNILESKNDVVDIFHREHDRNYGFTLMVDPRPRFGFEFGYNYDDIFSTTNICYVFAFVPPVASPLCASSGGAPFISGVSRYDNKINFGYANLVFRPVKRVTANLGYSLTSSSGN